MGREEKMIFAVCSVCFTSNGSHVHILSSSVEISHACNVRDRGQCTYVCTKYRAISSCCNISEMNLLTSNLCVPWRAYNEISPRSSRRLWTDPGADLHIRVTAVWQHWPHNRSVISHQSDLMRVAFETSCRWCHSYWWHHKFPLNYHPKMWCYFIQFLRNVSGHFFETLQQLQHKYKN